jgi:hypothetical protein
MKAEPKIDLELKKVYKATIDVVCNAHKKEDGKITMTWDGPQKEENYKIFFGEQVVAQLKYDHVQGLIEIFAEGDLADYVAEELPLALVNKYGSWELRNNQSLDKVDKAWRFLEDMAYDVKVRKCRLAGSPWDTATVRPVQYDQWASASDLAADPTA